MCQCHVCADRLSPLEMQEPRHSTATRLEADHDGCRLSAVANRDQELPPAPSAQTTPPPRAMTTMPHFRKSLINQHPHNFLRFRRQWPQHRPSDLLPEEAAVRGATMIALSAFVVNLPSTPSTIPFLASAANLVASTRANHPSTHCPNHQGAYTWPVCDFAL